MSRRRPSARSVLLDLDSELMQDEEADRREKQFFNQLILSNGTLKTTFAGRLTDVDLECSRLLLNYDREVALLDVAVSSGVTTYEWSQSLRRSNIEFTIDAFDLCVDGVIFSAGESFNVLVDSTGRPLQFEVFGRVVENSFGETISRQLKRLLPVAMLRLAHVLWRYLLRFYDQMYPVKLVTRHLKDSRHINVFEFDLADAEQLSASYDMIRAANILNLAYFDREFIRLVVLNLTSKIKEGGFLCVVRTHSDNSNHGTIFRKSENRLSRFQSFGNGSEIDQIVASI